MIVNSQYYLICMDVHCFAVPEAPVMDVEVVDSTTLKVTWELVPPTQATMVAYRLYVMEPGATKPLKMFIKLEYDTEQVVTKLRK